MADKKVSELDAIAGSATAADDLFLIVDASGSVTKKITRAELNNAIEQDVLSTVDINGGTIDSTVIGGTTPAAGDFTTLGATGNITVGGTVDGRDVATDGTKLDGIASSATANPNAIDNIVEDTSPQLGGALDVNGNSITSASNGDITIDPNGTGDIVLDANVQIGTTTEGISDYGDTLTIADSDHCGMTIRSGTSSEGNVYFSDGTSGDAEYKGIVKYDHSSNAMSFWSNSLRRMDITSGGNVGIGTTTIDFGLTVEKDNGNGYIASFRKSSSDPFLTAITTGGITCFQGVTSNGAAYSNTAINPLGGNVGIGKSSSITDKLHIENTGANCLLSVARTDGAAGRLVMQHTSGVGALQTTGSVPLTFGTADIERMRLDSSGNLLHGKTASGIANNGIELRANNDVLITKDGATALYLNRKSSDGEIIEFRKDGTGVGVIGTQNWGIGTSSPQKNLQITSSTATLRLEESGGSSKRLDFEIDNSAVAKIMANQSGSQIAFHTVGSEKARFISNSTPHFLVGCTSEPSSSVAGTAISTTDAGSFQSFAGTTNTSTHAAFGNTNGVLGTIRTTASATQYNTSSDRRLKSNIQDAESASDKIDAIQVRQFDWNADDSHQDYGLIAQELQPIEPMAVTGDADSDQMMGVDYSKLVPMLIKEIQELRGRVAALEAN